MQHEISKLRNKEVTAKEMSQTMASMAEEHKKEMHQKERKKDKAMILKARTSLDRKERKAKLLPKIRNASKKVSPRTSQIIKKLKPMRRTHMSSLTMSNGWRRIENGTNKD